MLFVGQLYSCERMELSDVLCLHFYICDDCRETYDGPVNDKLPIQMLALPVGAPRNTTRTGCSIDSWPKRFIDYVALEDPMDQKAWTRIGSPDLEVEHLCADKVGGLFPYDGYEGYKITTRNRMIAQFFWEIVGGPIYVYCSDKDGLYMQHYR